MIEELENQLQFVQLQIYLPEIEVVAGDAFNSSLTDFELMSEEVKTVVVNDGKLEAAYKKVPMIDLPLGATEDRVCGTIDIEKALNRRY